VQKGWKGGGMGGEGGEGGEGGGMGGKVVCVEVCLQARPPPCTSHQAQRAQITAQIAARASWMASRSWSLLLSNSSMHTVPRSPSTGAQSTAGTDHSTDRSTHLVDGDAVLVAHLVELVDAHHAAVRQHHGARLQALLACARMHARTHGWAGAGRRRASPQAPPACATRAQRTHTCTGAPVQGTRAVLDVRETHACPPPPLRPGSTRSPPTGLAVRGDCRCEAYARRASARGAHGVRGGVHDRAQHLRLGHARVAHLGGGGVVRGRGGGGQG
jgi:hypothetical protein